MIVFYIATYFVSYFNIIIDIRNVDDDLSDETIKAYTEGVKPVQVFTEKIKVAVITYSPSQVAGATLYKLFESKAIECEVFSTLEIALHWLGIDEIDFGKIDFYKKV
ncbi:MAG: hypothetical protein JW798_16160 [Prolixibacteraceae bacterium]|nr:hypothetical protein [Prolixibacteraceae bacterium]